MTPIPIIFDPLVLPFLKPSEWDIPRFYLEGGRGTNAIPVSLTRERSKLLTASFKALTSVWFPVGPDRKALISNFLILRTKTSLVATASSRLSVFQVLRWFHQVHNCLQYIFFSLKFLTNHWLIQSENHCWVDFQIHSYSDHFLPSSLLVFFCISCSKLVTDFLWVTAVVSALFSCSHDGTVESLVNRTEHLLKM